MAITRKTKVKVLITNSDAVKIVQKYFPDFVTDDPRMKPALSMPAKQLFAFVPGTTKEKQEQMFAELEAAELEG